MNLIKNNSTIYFDNQIFITQKFGGISRYYIDLFKSFEKLNFPFKVSKFINKNIYFNELYGKEIIVDCTDKHFKGMNRILFFVLKMIYWLSNFISKPKIIHHTYYDPFFYKMKNSIHISTVYDMIHEIFGSENESEYIKRKKDCIDHSDIIIAISNSTANDLIKIYNIPSHKIRVTYLSSSLEYKEDYPLTTLPESYFLFIGVRDWYKNFNLMIKSIAPLLIENRQLFLVCAGGGEFKKDEIATLHSLDIFRQVIYQEIINDQCLSTLYHKALFFVFPSLYEGFGIPILEAMNCDCPVVLSDSSSMKEVADYAGYYFNPKDEKSIYNACKEVFESKNIQEDLRKKGRQRRVDFSNEITARETIKVYNELLQNV